MVYILFFFVLQVSSYTLSNLCKTGEYYDSIEMDCRPCNANISMVPAEDGFGCTCAPDSVQKGVRTCHPCNATELISADGTTCVPRRCQKSGGRVVCRKCPADYISVTQNFDGSPMKEVTCFKCHRGYKVHYNKCVKCEACSCGRNEIVVSGKCLPKKYVMERPKYNDNKLHPNALLDIVKMEYLCSQADVRACHALARECVKYFYTTDLAGPCRLWLQRNGTYKGLPHLVNNSHYKDGISLRLGKNTILLGIAMYSPNGALQLLQDETQEIFSCLPPILIKVGEQYSVDCTKNVTELKWAFGKLIELYLPGEKFKAVPISILTPDGHFVQKGSWPWSRFRKIYLIDEILSTTTNMTTIVYLRKLRITFRVERELKGSLKLYINTEAHFATKSPLVQQITTTLLIDHEMPSAGVQRGLEIWGGILSSLLCIYALVQWRGVIRRGGLYISIVPLTASATADGIYFAVLFSTLHALAAEAGNLGITLPLSQTEENVVNIVLYSVIILKSLKVVWINWNQCRVDVFFIDWSQHSSSMSDSPNTGNNYHWRSILLAKEWMDWQTKRRSSPIATIVCTVGILQVTELWQSHIPNSNGYKWVIATIVYWFSYTIVFILNWIKNRLQRPISLSKVCSGAELSLIVFQEEYYAHYVHGRNEDADSSTNFTGPLATCRVVCASQIRTVYKKLAHNDYDLFRQENESNRVLLSKFLLAFFERALDGLSWVAIERTILERLLDIELTNREGSNVSTLLYDINDNTPSCLASTWWGEEWTLATFDCMLFGSIFVGTNNLILAAITTIIIYQILKELRHWFGCRNLRQKTGVEI